MADNQRRGDILIVIAMAIFGTYSLFIRLLPDVSPLLFVCAFQFVGLIVLASGLGNNTRKFREVSRPLFALAVAAIANDLLYFVSFRLTEVANAAAAHQSVSLFLLVLTPLILKIKTHRSEYLSLIISLIGMGILYSDGVAVGNSDDLLGITCGLASGFFYAVVIILYSSLGSSGLTLRQINAWRYAISSVLVLPALTFVDTWDLTASDVALIAGFGVLFAVIGTMIHTTGITIARPLHASILGKLEPAFAIVFAAIVLREQPPLSAIIGGTLIVGSSVWLLFDKSQRPALN